MRQRSSLGADNELQGIRALLRRIIRVGTVSARHPDEGTVQVDFRDAGLDGTPSWDCPVLQPKTHVDKAYWMPDAGERVVVLSLPQGAERGLVVGAFYNAEDGVPVSDNDKAQITFEDGTVVFYDRSENEMRVDAVGEVNILCDGDVLVESEGTATVRGQGVGTRLMRHAIDWLDQQGVVSQRLDATAEGWPIYEKLGFGQQFTVTRWNGTAQPLTSLTESVENFDEHKIASLLELDRTCVGVDRGKLLRRLAQESDVTTRIVHGADRDELDGYLITRPGALARQIGPGFARTEAAGRALFMDALHRYRGQPVMLDVPDDNSVAKATVEEAGLSPARQFIRMVRGDPACEEIKQLWLSSGPEKG